MTVAKGDALLCDSKAKRNTTKLKKVLRVYSVRLAFGQQIAVRRGQCVVISRANIILKMRQLSA